MWPSIDKSEAHLVHADYWPGNTLWKGDDLVAIIDWEEPRLGEPIWDIATIIQDSATFGMDIEDAAISHHRRMSGRALRDLDFWRMVIAFGGMPDPGVWVSGYRALDGGAITEAEVRANHTASIERLLANL
jgi:aminoglycoside phosphotransferase (APT) family kinase protein